MAICPGIYHLAEARDGLLARVRLPGGRITPAGLFALAEASERHGNGAIDLTNRANIQVRGLKPESADQFARELTTVGIATENPARDRLRNILASPIAGIAPDEVLDVSPLVDALDHALLTANGLDQLSPKFAFLFDGGDATGVGSLAYDAGFLAERSLAGTLFRLGLANQATDWVVSPENVISIALALVRLAADHNARMADLVTSMGVDDILARSSRDQLTQIDRPDESRRATRGAPLGRLPECGAIAAGFAETPPTASALRAIGQFAINAGASSIRVTPWRSLVIAGLTPAAADAALALAVELGLATKPSAVETIACVGARGCLRTRFNTEAAAEAVRALNQGWTGGKRSIHVSGCERGCARPGRADLLVIGRDGGAGIELHRRTTAGDAGPETLIRETGPAAAEIAEDVCEALNVGS